MAVGAPLTYLHTDQLGSTVLETVGVDVTADHRYFAYGRQRDAGPVVTNYRFTGQEEDATGLVYMNARYYDPVLGQFISPDTIVPDATNVLDYNRYMYGRGNPLRYNDPSGHCSNDEIMQHYGCSDWACVEAQFSEGGSFPRLWGWLYILQQAVDGDNITSWLNACSGSACNPQGFISGMFSRASTGSIGIIYSSGGMPDDTLQSGQRVGDNIFAYFASGGMRFEGYYSLDNSRGRHITATRSHEKHNYLHAPGLGLAGIKAGADFGPMMIEAAPATMEGIMIQGMLALLIAAAFAWGAEKCRRSPEKCKDGFMTEQGWTRSIFAVRYIGRAKEAREMIVKDRRLREKHLMQLYISSAFFAILGIYFLMSYVMA